ncbi:MAG: hypothetical protein WA885_20455 [Phormidesmis sp.]
MVFATEFDSVDQFSRRQTGRQRDRVEANPNTFDQKADGAVSRLSGATALSQPATDNVVPLQMNGAALRVSALPAKPKLPFPLQVLNRVQQGSAVLTTLLVTSALVVYGSTVYIDKSTNRALTQLDALQGESQQLTTANESIKQSLAEQAIAENSGLKPYEAGDVLFLSPAPRRAAVVKPDSADADLPHPLGY